MSIALLLPAPQKVTLTEGTFSGQTMRPLTTIDPAYPHPQGYTLTIESWYIGIAAQTQAGAFYGQMTLMQLIRLYGRSIPCMVIEDWPDIPVRGYMLDISRDRVPTMEMLELRIERLASIKINQIQLYMEHTFAYPSHPEVWRDASPLTADEIRRLDEFCKARFIDLVPCQNGFGHMERWLKHPRYADLAITPDMRTNNMGDQRLPSTLNPLDPRSTELLASIYDELLPHFSSELFNANADEPFELGKGRTEQAVAAHGKGRVYLDFLRRMHTLVTERGRRMLFWGDIIIHYPELVPELPDGLTALDWGYEAIHDFDSHAQMYADAGVPFYLCPGTSTWNAIAGCTDNMLENIRNAVRAGVKHGATGILLTDWGDNGHWQHPGVSWPGISAAAAMMWNASSVDMTAETLAPVLDAHVFEGTIASILFGLGNIYRLVGPADINGNFLAFSLQRRYADLPKLMRSFETWSRGGTVDISRETLNAVISLIDSLRGSLAAARTRAVDGEQLRAELFHAAAMLRHAARRLLFMQGERGIELDTLRQEWRTLEAEHRHLWLNRSRPGGLDDSAARFAVVRDDYADLAAAENANNSSETEGQGYL